LDYTLAMVYVNRVSRYGVLVSELKNEYAKFQDDYLADLATALALVNLYETHKNDQIQPHAQRQNNHNHGKNQ